MHTHTHHNHAHIAVHTRTQYQCIHVHSTTPLTCTLFTSLSTASQVLPLNPPASATAAPVQRPTVGTSSDAALMMTGVAMNTSPTDPTASTVRAGAGAGKEAVIAAPATEVPIDPM
ncbi:hypothetical protein [Neochlamydia sp. TUME1]|uniref:hypothetical protein n=1 Tax=Neochlamydia sp. TUME1 TaxID=1478174 RepID=UPI0012BAA6F0|nr:hypothetical protein [Neochlamydia sp. TUME1]